MEYPQSFIKRAKEAFPDWQQFHLALDRGSEIVGRYLDDSMGMQMSPLQIIEAFREGREQDVLVAAKVADRRARLCSEWHKLHTALLEELRAQRNS